MFSSLKKKPHNDRTHDDGVCKMQKIPARCNLAAFESLSQLVIPDIQPGKSKENTPSTWNSYLLTWGSLLHYKLIWSDVKATWLCRASEGNEYVLNTLCCVCVYTCICFKWIYRQACSFVLSRTLSIHSPHSSTSCIKCPKVQNDVIPICELPLAR